ncbi:MULTISPECIES: cupin domain-containing protein [Pseudomonas]|uniref:cupin domain-containing protein n=1 Tax=Pseudomonas TaxID=286 RepID=UPI0015554E58|nr:cupin domain-containing protein [Pseudomonas tumuqii]
MSQRPQAVPSVQVDNERVIVTEWRFAPGAETGRHRHGYDYLVLPMTDGTLLLETPEGEKHAPLVAGQAYYRQAGIEHNVINASDHDIVFVETEIK